MNKVEIKPITKTLNTLEIIGVSVSLDNSARISYIITGDYFGENGVLTMDGATYSAWGSDDDYVINWVLTELGLERA